MGITEFNGEEYKGVDSLEEDIMWSYAKPRV